MRTWSLHNLQRILLGSCGFFLTQATAAEPVLPTLREKSVIEFHGKLDGQLFWARLLAADQQFAGHRVLQLVYSPPAPEALAGAQLTDCPFILLDDHARILAWNGRDGLSQVVPLAPSGYRVTRELTQGTGDDTHEEAKSRAFHGAIAWDLRLAPLLLALTWSPTTHATVPVVDLFGARAGETMSAQIEADQAQIAEEKFHIRADELGNVASVENAKGEACLVIDEWLLTQP